MSFNEYLEKEIPNFIEVITEEELINLKNNYEIYLEKMQIEKNILLRGMNSSSGIDYANDFEKAGAERMRAKHNLDAQLDKVKSRLKIKEENKMIK